MNIVEKPISELKPYPKNPKIHSEKQIEQIASSIKLTKELTAVLIIGNQRKAVLKVAN